MIDGATRPRPPALTRELIGRVRVPAAALALASAVRAEIEHLSAKLRNNARVVRFPLFPIQEGNRLWNTPQ